MWTVKFQMFKLDLEKTEEPEIKLPTFFGSLKKQKSSRKTSTCVLLTTSKPLTVWMTTNRGRFLKRWEYQPPWEIYPLWNLYASQEETIRIRHGKRDWFRIAKGCIISHCLFDLYAKYILRNAGLDDSQARIKFIRRNISKLRYADDTTLMEEGEE